ncbi:MAG: PIG-L family deacetylase [Lagierella massiliensis]|nr:PIG-L family deacetylase [Lagierella massiliensis]
MWKDYVAKILYYPIKWMNIFNIRKIYKNKHFKNKLIELEIPLGNTLLISPHVDDEIIGMGGLLLQNREFNENMDLIYLTDSSACKPINGVDMKITRAKEAKIMAKSLGIRSVKIIEAENNNVNKYTNMAIEQLEKYLKGKNYDKIFIVNPFDAHYEHRWSNYIFAKTIRNLNFNSDIYLYEASAFLPDSLINTYCKFSGKEKRELFKIFESQKIGMDFDIFMQLNRHKGMAFDEESYVEFFSRLSIKEYENMMDKIDDKMVEKLLPRRIANHRTFYKVLRDNKNLEDIEGTFI